MPRIAQSSLTLAALVSFASSGCVTTSRYQPQLVARGELTLRYDGGFEMWAGGRRVSHGLAWNDLSQYVRCVPDAQRHADQASSRGGTAIAFSTLGVVLGAASLGTLVAAGADSNGDHLYPWLASGLGASTAGAIFAGLSRMMKNSANGHAVDALNYYNDAVGSLGATCDDLTYPAPAGDFSPPPLPPAAPSPYEAAPPPPPPAPLPLISRSPLLP